MHIAECLPRAPHETSFSAADHSLKSLVVCQRQREGRQDHDGDLPRDHAMAQSGQRVLLIDTDMRRRGSTSRPACHAELASRPDPRRQLRRSHQADGGPTCFILPCGPLPPHPAEL